MADLEVFELQHDEGPCIDCFRTGRMVVAADLEHDRARWPRFASEALAAGFRAAWALPMRLRESTIGSLNLLRTRPEALAESDLDAAQALADVATIGLIQQRAAEDARLLTEQLQTALDSRIVIEQAKGVLAEHRGLSMTEAFAALRAYARAHQARLAMSRPAWPGASPGWSNGSRPRLRPPASEPAPHPYGCIAVADRLVPSRLHAPRFLPGRRSG